MNAPKTRKIRETAQLPDQLADENGLSLCPSKISDMNLDELIQHSGRLKAIIGSLPRYKLELRSVRKEIIRKA